MVLERLIKIWAQVLGQKHVYLTDSFFDLGGESLLALQLILHIEREFSVKLPFASLFENPTLERMAKDILSRMGGCLPITLTCRDGRLPIPLVPATNDTSPFFAVYGMENVRAFRALASRLRPGQAFYVLPALAVDESEQMYPDLETMASAYLGLIQSVQPKGPYYLGGRCMGGPVALEIAQQFLRSGEKVALLVIFDSAAPRLKDDDGYMSAGDPRIASNQSVTRPRGHFRDGMVTHNLKHYVHKKFRKHLRKHLKKIPDLVYKRLSGQSMRYVLRLRAANKTLRKRYRANLYPGQITLIRSEQFVSRTHKDYHTTSWRELSGGGLRTHVVQGRHRSMFDEPYVTDLTKTLQNCIDKARETS
jgi:thioesterase domain-containing protein/acyl carrier protein